MVYDQNQKEKKKLDNQMSTLIDLAMTIKFLKMLLHYF